MMSGACAVDVLKHTSGVSTIGIRLPQNLDTSADSNVRCAIDLKIQPANEADSGTDLNWLKSSSANS